MKMDTPSENSIWWGGIIFVALARNVLVLRFRSAIQVFHFQEAAAITDSTYNDNPPDLMPLIKVS